MLVNQAANNRKTWENEFSETFTKYYSRLCFFASGILLDKASAEDTVAEVFEKIWLKGSWGDVEFCGPYLYKAVLNGCMNKKKRTSIYDQHTYQAGKSAPKDENAILEHIYQAEAFHELYNAIEKLPPQCKTVINLSYRQGLKINEIAELLNVSPSTIKTQRSRGIIMLRKLLSTRAFLLAMIIAKIPH
ncbi:sigma-70 family RNA polymerase sigma factor [Chitinophaga sp. CC14]|uniref:RNA polymerase sigma factor n=1 Tax=Chitinophaga sp. CC14 TaxID=3029199 RepID=UPI003B7FAD34